MQITGAQNNRKYHFLEDGFFSFIEINCVAFAVLTFSHLNKHSRTKKRIEKEKKKETLVVQTYQHSSTFHSIYVSGSE